MVFKPGRLRIAHFAHRPDAGCAFGARMSVAHLQAQGRIAEALRARGLSVELEARLAGLAGDRRVDVLAWPADRPEARVAVEVQASDLGIDSIEARTASYQALGVAPLWLRLLDFGRFAAVTTLPFRGSVWIERHGARAWERWAHDHLGGRLWFMDAATQRAWRGTMVQAHAARGGALRTVSRWVDLELDGPFDLADLKLKRGAAPGPDGVRRLAAWFTPPGEEAATAPFAPLVRAAITREGGVEARDLRVCVDGRWIAATVEGARRDWRTVRGETRPVLGAG